MAIGKLHFILTCIQLDCLLPHFLTNVCDNGMCATLKKNISINCPSQWFFYNFTTVFRTIPIVTVDAFSNNERRKPVIVPK